MRSTIVFALMLFVPLTANAQQQTADTHAEKPLVAPPAPAETKPAPSATTDSSSSSRPASTPETERQDKITKRLNELSANSDYIIRLAEPQAYQKEAQDANRLKDIRRKKGEIRAIVKNLLEFPSYLFGKDIQLVFDKGEDKIRMIVLDSSGNKLGTVEFSLEGQALKVIPNRPNLDALARSMANSDYARANGKIDDNLLKMLTRSAPIAYRAYALTDKNTNKDEAERLSLYNEGEFHQLAKDLMNVEPAAKHRQLYSQITQLGSLRQGYYSSAVAFLDRESKSPVGVMLFHYDQNGNIKTGSWDEKTVAADVVNGRINDFKNGRNQSNPRTEPQAQTQPQTQQTYVEPQTNQTQPAQTAPATQPVQPQPQAAPATPATPTAPTQPATPATPAPPTPNPPVPMSSGIEV